MSPINRKQLKWERERERFRIADPFPPKPLRQEKPIGDILSSILHAQPAATALPDILIERWPLIAGEQLAKHTSPASLCDKVLTVYADHPGWLTELRRLPKNHLLKKISSIPGIPSVQDIRFHLDPAINPRRN